MTPLQLAEGMKKSLEDMPSDAMYKLSDASKIQIAILQNMQGLLMWQAQQQDVIITLLKEEKGIIIK